MVRCGHGHTDIRSPLAALTRSSYGSIWCTLLVYLYSVPKGFSDGVYIPSVLGDHWVRCV